MLSPVLLGLGLWKAHEAFVKYDKDDSEKLLKYKAHATAQIESSPLGKSDLRNQAAAEYFGESASVGVCDWTGHLLWNDKRKNPNLWSSTKGATGFEATCNAEVKHGSDDDDMSFVYTWSPDYGITAVSWRYAQDDGL